MMPGAYVRSLNFPLKQNTYSHLGDGVDASILIAVNFANPDIVLSISS